MQHIYDHHPLLYNVCTPIGEDSFMDLDFNGTFFVNDDEDDDYAGFVFNYQSNKRFMVVVWKKQNEIYSERSPFVSRALSGIQIKVLLLLLLCTKYIAYLLSTIW